MKKKSKGKLNFMNLLIMLLLFCFGIFLIRTIYLATSKTIDGINMKEFAENRSTMEETLIANRGTIYDKNGNPLAQNVSSYTLIAYLDPKRSEKQDTLYHVQDKETTAKKLATIISMKEEEILAILSQKDLYQVEFGNAGKGLTELEKEKIEELNLPGIDFIEDKKRYYPNGDFASYTLGYARKNDNDKITGEMGLESLLDEVLEGQDGYRIYQKDVNGYKIPGTKEELHEASDGNNVYLTIDSNIQFFVEQAMNEVASKYKFDWMNVIVADAKTGKILGLSQRPSFNPNTKDISNWIDYTVAQAYEPGSIMKIYTYMAALETGKYDGNAKFKSGRYITDDNISIYDWKRTGFGDITYDQGFVTSSNVGVINMINNYLDKTTLKNYFTKMGFGKKTGITLANEDTGKIEFNYQTEIYNAGFGQGITTTPMQHIQALTAVANNGIMLKPYIIDKVTDSKGNVLYTGKKEEIGQVASASTTSKIRDLMYDVVHSDWYAATGSNYRLNGYDLIGKTGTAQLVNPNTGAYYTNDYYTTKSFVGMWPKDDPEVIIYTSVNKSSGGSSKPLTSVVKSLVVNISKYLNIFSEEKDTTINNYTLDNYLNKNVSNVKKQLEDNKVKTIIIGTGDKVVGQYPRKGDIVGRNDKVFLLTNDNNYTMPNFNGYSKKQAEEVCKMLDLTCKFESYGYVKSQSIKAGTKIDKSKPINFVLKELYK